MDPLAVSEIVLWLVVVALALVVLALARQVGVLHERIAPAGALITGRGPRVGEAAPVVAVVDRAGQPLEVGGTRADGKSLLLLFVSPSCPVCRTLLPSLKASRRAESSWLEVVLAGDGDEAAAAAYVEREDLGSFRYVLSTPLGLAYQVGRLPFAALIDEAGVLRARGLVNSREHLESLFEAKRLGVASLQEYLEGRTGRPAA